MDAATRAAGLVVGLSSVQAATGGLTVSVKVCEASGETPFDAVMVIGKLPVPLAVPARKAVPLPLSVKVTPDGRAPVSLRDGVGAATVVTVKLSATPWLKASESELVMEGAVGAVLNAAPNGQVSLSPTAQQSDVLAHETPQSV
jgi:hypothetical protein